MFSGHRKKSMWALDGNENWLTVKVLAVFACVWAAEIAGALLIALGSSG